MQTYTVYGLIASAAFQKCVEAAEHVDRTAPDEFHVAVVREVPHDFLCRVAKMREQGVVSDEQAAAATEVVVVCDSTGEVLTGEAFLAAMTKRTSFRILPMPAGEANSYEKTAQRAWCAFLRERGNQYCWMSVKIGDTEVGRITFELYSNVLPRTCNNFWHLCRGDLAPVTAATDAGPEATTVRLTYKDTTFFRVLKEAWVMGGDVVGAHTGNGGYSCYGRHFPDESFAIPHDAAGVLGMCNDGPHTNASSFYITRKKMSWMNGRYVAFGRVIDGMRVVDAIHDVAVKHNQSPCEKILIADCGVIDVLV